MGTNRPLLLLQDPEKLAQEVAQQLTDKLDGSERMDISKPAEARYPSAGRCRVRDRRVTQRLDVGQPGADPNRLHP